MEEGSKRLSDRRIKLDVLHGFGSNSSKNLRNSVSIIEDENKSVMFPIGKYFALKNHERSEMEFIKLSENVEEIVCMAVSSNKKYLAVSQKIKHDSYPLFALFNIANSVNKGEREKIFRYTDTKSEVFLQMAFSGSDARFIVALTGSPEFQLIFIDLARMKVSVSSFSQLDLRFLASKSPNSRLILKRITSFQFQGRVVSRS